MLVEEIDFFGTPSLVLDMLSIIEELYDLIDKFKLFFKLLLFFGSLKLCIKIFNNMLTLVQIFLSELMINNFDISDWVKITFIMGYIFVWECSNNVIDSINCRNVRQELITKTFTIGGTFNKTSNISDGNLGQNLGLGVVDLTKLLKSLIWDVNFSNIWVNSTERIIFSSNLKLGEEIKGG